MAKKYIYIRVSTIKQDYTQQMGCINGYFARMGINPAAIDSIVQEKISGTVKASERKVSELLKQCQTGDTIFISELSRISRNMSDLFAIVSECCERGISLIQCKDGTQIENNSIGGKALLFAMSLAAEIEVANIRQRTQMGIDVIKSKIDNGEEYISKRSGKVVKHLGRDKGCDLSVARAASIESKRKRAAEWRANNIGYNTVRRWYYEGRSKVTIIADFNAFHKSDPEQWSTITGGELSIQTLNIWCREFKQDLLYS